MFKHILIPVDGSEPSLNAARAALALAKDEGAKVVIYHASEPVEAYFAFEGGAISPTVFNALQEQTQARSARIAGEVETMAKEAGVSYEVVIDTAVRPHLGITDTAKRLQCDLIFMGSHGRTGLQAFVLGSVAQKVVTTSSVPVMIHR